MNKRFQQMCFFSHIQNGCQLLTNRISFSIYNCIHRCVMLGKIEFGCAHIVYLIIFKTTTFRMLYASHVCKYLNKS